MSDKSSIYDLLLSRTDHKLTRTLVEALRDGGWTLVTVRGGAILLFAHPASGTELPSPDWACGNSRTWGGATFSVHRQLSVNWNSGEKNRAYALMSRELHAPWVRVSERTLSFKSALAYVAEPWNPGIVSAR